MPNSMAPISFWAVSSRISRFRHHCAHLLQISPLVQTSGGSSGGREMGAQLLAGDLGWIGVDQDEREHGRSRPVVDPGVHRAALHDDVARLHMHDLTAIELEIALA